MKIGVNTLFFVPGDVGGTEVYFRQNMKFMVADNPSHSFILFVTADNEQVLQGDLRGMENVSFVRLRFRASFRPLRIMMEQTLLPLLVQRAGVEVLWSPGYTAPLWCPCKQVVTIHDLQYKTHPEDLTFLERVTLDFLVRSACKRCDRVIAVSHFSKGEILRYRFAPEKKVTVVHEGVDPKFGVLPENKIAKSLEQIPQGTPYILCVAHTYPHKQVELLIQAFGFLVKDIPHHLVLLGKPRRGEKEVQVALNAVSQVSRVHRFMGLPYDELVHLYHGADIFVLPSEYEGFGLPVLEALLAGVPVVTSRKASLPEVGGECAFYAEENSAEGFVGAIKEVLRLDRRGRERVVEHGRLHAESFSWQKSSVGTMGALLSFFVLEPGA